MVKSVSGIHSRLSIRLRQAREAIGIVEGELIGQKDFAERAGISQKSYNLYEGGAHRISIPNAIRLREAYGISLDFIYCGSRDTLPHNIAVALSQSPDDTASKKSKLTPES